MTRKISDPSCALPVLLAGAAASSLRGWHGIINARRSGDGPYHGAVQAKGIR